jgi:hypothetical protein
MGVVWTKCPVTGQAIDTRIETDDASFHRFPPFIGHVFCPHCKTDHEWTKDSAWVADAGTTSS